MQALSHYRSRARRSPLLPGLLCVVAVTTAAASAAAQTQDRLGPYVGATVGKPDWKADSIGGISGDTSGTAFKLYGGYRLHRNFAAELSGVRLGRLSGPLGEAKANGYALDAVGLLPLSDTWTAFARAGAARIKTSAGGASDRNTAPKFGLGAQYQINNNTALRGEWERYRLDAFGSKSNVDTFSLGAQVSF